MAAEGGKASPTTVSGRGTSLSSSSVFSVANSLSPVQIDPLSPIVTTLVSNPNHHPLPAAAASPLPPPSSNFKFYDPTPQEARASLLLLYLNKLSLSSSTDLPFKKRDALNNDTNNNNNLYLDVDGHDVTEEYLLLSGKSTIVAAAICALLDHHLSALSALIDAVAALSCEVSVALVSAFGSIASSMTDKDRIGVASDMKVLLNGSKLAGKLDVSDDAISGIPYVHGSFREIARSVRCSARAELSSPVFAGALGVYNTKALVKPFYALPNELWDVGQGSWTRAKLNVDAMMMNDVYDPRSTLSEMFDRECPRVFDSVGLGKFLMSYAQAVSAGEYVRFFFFARQREYVRFFHMLNEFTETVRKIVSWEAITALVSLEGSGIGGDGALSAEAETVKASEGLKPNKKKSEKGKKDLGKGTGVLVKFINDRLRGEERVEPCSRALVEKWLRGLLTFLDPKNSALARFWR